MTLNDFSLPDLGWSAHFLGQLSVEEIETLTPYRLFDVHRDRATGVGAGGEILLGYPPGLTSGDTAVGDWVLADPDTSRIVRVLDRRTEISRRAAGGESRRQLIAANIDTLFIVTSCNDDFNVARLERYLALAFDAGASAVIVLTKADLCADPDDYLARAWAISPRIADVIALDAREVSAAEKVSPWLGRGRTVAFVGSSGVGKSTLVSSLTGRAIATQGIREDDAKGRHTTTGRSIYRASTGALVIDMPGMRELGLQDVAEGIDAVFDDIAALAERCRFRDCAHEGEPGCAVRAAVEAGDLDGERLRRWKKLRLEDARNSETLHERRDRFRAFGRMVKEAKEMAKGKRGVD